MHALPLGTNILNPTTLYKTKSKLLTLVAGCIFSNINHAQEVVVDNPADPIQNTQNNTNDAVTKAWAEQNVGAQTPELVKQDDGSTKVEWHGGAVVDMHWNDIYSPAGVVNTPFNNINSRTLSVQSDLRGTNAAGDVNYFQIGATTSNDRSILSQFSRQINQVQVGRAGQGYLIAAGDVAPNFSSLSTSTGVRGLIAQRQFNALTFSGYTGYIVPSWEYLESRIPRTQLLREVLGGKAEYQLNKNFSAYITTLGAYDKANSADFAGINPTQVNTNTIGLQYADEHYQVTAESGRSRFSAENQDGIAGRANIIDGSWHNDTMKIQSGFHDLGAGYVSLSGAAQAGNREKYFATEWSAASWVSLGADLRNSKNFTLATLFFPSQLTDTDSGSIRANINFGVNHPGWQLALQENISNSTDPNQFETRREQSTIGLNYANSLWNSALSYGLEQIRIESTPSNDNNAHNWQASVGRTFSNADSLTAATWTISTNLSSALQLQNYTNGFDTRSMNNSLNVSAQKNDWGLLNVSFTHGSNSRANGLAALTVNSIFLDASRPIGTKGRIKIYGHETRRNLQDINTANIEKVVGLELGYTF